MSFVFSVSISQSSQSQRYSVLQVWPSGTQQESGFSSDCPEGPGDTTQKHRPCVKHWNRWDTGRDRGLATVLSNGPLWEAVSKKRQPGRASSHLMQIGHLGNIPWICLSFFPTLLSTPFIFTSLELSLLLQNISHKVFSWLWFLGNPDLLVSSFFLKLKYKDITSSFLPPIFPMSSFTLFQVDEHLFFDYIYVMITLYM